MLSWYLLQDASFFCQPALHSLLHSGLSGFCSTFLWAALVRSPSCLTTWGRSSPLQSCRAQRANRETKWVCRHHGPWKIFDILQRLFVSKEFSVDWHCDVHICKGCCYRHHGTPRKPQEETEQLSGRAEQRCWKVSLCGDQWLSVSSIKYKSYIITLMDFFFFNLCRVLNGHRPLWNEILQHINYIIVTKTQPQ